MHPIEARVLLVDHDHASLWLLAGLLQLDGYEVVCADSLTTALQRSEQSRLDLLIADIERRDGTLATELCRLPERCHLPGIALSGLRAPVGAARSSTADFQEYLYKPVTLKELKAAIERTLALGVPRVLPRVTVRGAQACASFRNRFVIAAGSWR
jgi:CheY-like chemotaxis protein